MSRRRPIVIALLFGAGLIAGLLHFWGTIGAAVALALLFRHREGAATAAALMALGVVMGSIAVAADANSCGTRLRPGRQELIVEPTDPARRQHTRVRLRLSGFPCVGVVAGRWPVGALERQGRVRAVVRWIPRDGVLGRGVGTMVVEDVLEVLREPAVMFRLRRWIMNSVADLYGPRAPVVNALVLNRKDGLDPAVREAFVRAGLVHLLAISGFHVGVVVLWVLAACRLLRLSRLAALGITTATVTAYVALLGWPPAASRAAVLAVLVMGSRLRQRHVSSGTILAVTVLLLLLAGPWTVAQVGAWLSVVALTGVMAFERWGRRVLGGGWFVRSVAASLGATLATAPVTAAVFGTVSFTGIVLNVVAMPLAGLALPAVFGSVLIAPVVPPLGEALATSGGLLLAGLTWLARWGAGVPGGALVTTAGWPAALPWLAVLGLALWLMGRRNTSQEAARRALWLVAGAAWMVLLWPGGAPAGESGLALHFLDVGQGDGIAIRTPGGHWVVVDGGPRTGRWDAGRRTVVPFLRRHGVKRLEAVVVTHADADHLGGIPSIVDAVQTEMVLEPGGAPETSMYLAFLDELAAAGIAWRPGRAGDRFDIDGVVFEVVHPDTSWAQWGHDINEDSIVLLVRYGGFEALLTGDIGLPAELALQGRIGRVDVLKVGHHGSKGSTGEEWLEELAPSTAIISVGLNRYGHPAAGVIERLDRHGVSVWRTDHEGDVTIRTDGRTFSVIGRGRQELLTAVP